ncbi:hypothetical protein DCAR_0730010 [Daucus carota subsp. sativus]|uniref:Peroxisomal membrane protein PEX14 n=1 Tax=Daucus carota subsp. sativus TaxID=79200 RepID=A0A164ULR4_DAUCS|nr:PREDICTED: peroxisomal membrane protein PEX14 [Daucus carota subsp. sativus]WOH10541.1 hypothetical protein DCAR_0730010 [Daucus carota subsp. sativus]
MATQSAPPSNFSDQNPVSEVAKPASEVHQDAKDISPPSVFVNSEPIREDQVQNAVKFLSHPKVKGSPVMYRRSFLERKGLTKEEIDEAFRRVPDPTPTVSTGQPAEDGQLNSSKMQQQSPTQAIQPASNTPIGTVSKGGTSALYHLGWQQALLAVGLLAISGAGTALVFKKAIVPRLKSWIRKVVSEEDEDLANKTNSKPSLAEEAAAAAKSAAAAAADVARASQDMLISKNGEKQYFEELMSLLGVQVQEMKSMSNAIRNLEGKTSISGQEDHGFSLNNSKPPYANGKSDFTPSSARPVSPPASVEPSGAPPHPKSYMEIMAMVQRGERPSNIRDVNDLPPNPNQPVPTPSLAPRPKPWEVGQVQNSSNQALQSQDNGFTQMNGNNSAPWWQQKQSNNVRINDIESVDEYSAGSSGAQTIDRPIQRSWVPPQPPPVAMAEAAAAIRQPKKSTFQSEPLTDDQFLARSSELTNELQRVTKISESGGITEANGESYVPNTEIQTEESNSYVEA